MRNQRGVQRIKMEGNLIHNAPLEKTSARIEVKDGLQSVKTVVAGEGQDEREKVPVKLCSDVKGEKYLK